MKKYRVALVGTGARSLCYARAYAGSDEIEVAAMADPDPGNRKAVIARAGLKGAIAEYARWQDLLARHADLDGVVICTPNHLHAEIAVPCLERGIPVALEKPMCTTLADCERVLETARARQGRLLIGFVLRSSPYYRKIHAMIASGAIGRVLTVQADELASFGVSSVICRGGWRRHTRFSGGSMMEKSSHDLDMLNWLIGSRPVALSAFGGALLFRPNPNLPAACPDCPHRECPYFAKPAFSEAAGDHVLHDFLGPERHACIYNIDKDVADNQSVSLQYANGAIANFMLSFNCGGERAGRNFHAVGTRGRLWGNIEANELNLYQNATRQTTRVDLGPVASGHNGGDEAHAMELLRMMKSPGYQPDQDAYAGYLSTALCIAADRAMTEGRLVRLRYAGDGRITLA